MTVVKITTNKNIKENTEMNPSKLNENELNHHAFELEKEGYTIIPNIMSDLDLENAKNAIDETLEQEKTIAQKYGLQNENLLMCFNAQGKHRYFPGMLTRHPEPFLVAQRILGKNMFAHNLAIRIPLPAGKKDWSKLGGHLHADWHPFTVNPFIGGKHYPLAIQSVWCISEFTEENGATYIWPRSHLSLKVPPEQPKKLPSGWIRAKASAGSAVLWDSSLWHTSGTNFGEAPRYSLVFYFQRWWVRGFNDAYRLWPPKGRQQMTAEEKKIWGLEAAVPPNTHFREMTDHQIKSLTPEEKAVLNIAAF